ncbi:MAG: hypothetical protein WC708_13900, partial [Lentisphaeria bacterium]
SHGAFPVAGSYYSPGRRRLQYASDATLTLIAARLANGFTWIIHGHESVCAVAERLWRGGDVPPLSYKGE